MLFNRSQWDTLPPVSVPKLGGVDYRLGPGAQVPMSRNQDIKAINLGAPPPNLALELVKLLGVQRANYFGLVHPEVLPTKLQIKQEKAIRDFYRFWRQIGLHMFALTLQYNPQEIVRVTGASELADLDPFTIFEELDFGMNFDVKELNPEYLMEKLDIIQNKLLPQDVTGLFDRTALTRLQARMVDPLLAQQVVQDKAVASQKIYRDVEMQVMKMALGNEAEYTENDPTAPMKLQFLGTIIGSNPRYQAALQADPRFKALLENYQKNLQQSVAQQQNAVVGRIGVKPMSEAGMQGM
jgi:hypothetical protein